MATYVVWALVIIVVLGLIGAASDWFRFGASAVLDGVGGVVGEVWDRASTLGGQLGDAASAEMQGNYKTWENKAIEDYRSRLEAQSRLPREQRKAPTIDYPWYIDLFS